ncbi:putative MFS family arabinose efflux permease [Rhizomicrobium palustre]|uniref:Putative MFS family arabinose efflux permease n=1 Tax=Rhizomicrobium palustre TaxID=189966 RepID=A0A846MU69_9PROT|nr:MFS transporter [Rhizomicrobium palustre]NIK87048.1 putative MFS family arabinose efflux permease [Rhizomicrobium palustre]
MQQPSQITPRLTFAMALASGISVAGIYYNQPMLGLLGASFHSPLIKLVPTVTQLGYAAGLFLLVPLGDLQDRRKLILGQFLLLAVALAAAALAPSAGWLIAASLLVGIGATGAQHIIPLAAHLSSPHTRGKTVGSVMAGLLGGILLSQTLAGLVGAHGGWRLMFWLGVPVTLLGTLLMALMLPKDHAASRQRYKSVIASLGHIWREEPALRKATLVQASLFAAFSSLWATLALHLQEPRFGLGADAAGLFGLVGIVGVAAAPLAGRMADTRGPKTLVVLGIAFAAVAWAVLAFWNSIAGLVLAVALLNFGVQGALISNQHIIYALRPEARARLNTLFMSGMFLGGALGSAAAGAAYSAAGWGGVAAFALALTALAAVVEATPRRRVASV